jgi:hypothetical protein
LDVDLVPETRNQLEKQFGASKDNKNNATFRFLLFLSPRKVYELSLTSCRKQNGLLKHKARYPMET